MKAIELIKYLEEFAPPGVAWEKDNIGLQVGSTSIDIKNIFLTLDLDSSSLNQAISTKSNFIFTHHPLLFKPINKLTFDYDEKSNLVRKIVKNDITVYSAHTNFDFTKDGVSFELARILKLSNVTFLENQVENQIKLVVFVPAGYEEKIASAIFNAGGGVIGEYSKCSYQLKGTGTFEGSEASNPKFGTKENFEKVDEVRIEVLVNNWRLNKVLNAMIEAHPYEEPAYDIYPVKNMNVNFGFGAIGLLAEEMSNNEFLRHVSKCLRSNNLRFTTGNKKRIKKVAVCGGSGSDLLNSAINKNADAFVTADIKYHTFQDAKGKIMLVDAGHYETEIHSLKVIERKLNLFFKENKEKAKVFVYKGSTNPIKFYNY